MNAVHPGKWWHREEETDRIVCDLCPRQCNMKEGDRGFCFVRKVEGNQMVLDTYGRSTGFCIDPIEKKPLNHFYPGTSVLSFGTAGCNLGCQFCQNWDISKSREVAKLSSVAEPELIAQAAKELGCKSVAFTYNDPVIWAEYAIDTAKACRAIGIQSVAVTAGYISPEARREFYLHMDAANVDLKAFTEDFYRKITYSHLEPVLDTLRYLKRETDVWFEITNLIIPDRNDSTDELSRMCDWILQDLGPDVPVHFSAFHPDFRMMDRPRTPPETLLKAHAIATQAGLHYAYVGNIHDVAHSSTYCWSCSALLIERDWYQLGRYGLRGDLCGSCGKKQPGRFGDAAGDWGRKRQPVNLDSFRKKPDSQKFSPATMPILSNREGSPSATPVSLSNLSPISPNEASMSTHPLSTPVSLSSPASPAGDQSMLKLAMLKLDELSDHQKQSIQKAAQLVVVATVCNRKLGNEWLDVLGPMAKLEIMGMFTTLYRGSQLRGCCGFLGRPTTLSEAILSSAQRTAKEDKRMPSISVAELAYLKLDVSILASPVLLTTAPENRIEHIEVGKHGLKITRGQQAGLLLPSVAVEQNWTAQQFLEGVCRKAGLPESAWMDTDTRLETFEGVVIEGKIEHGSLPAELPKAQAPGNIESLLRLKQVAAQNVVALSSGATPTYYAPDAMDGNVHGVVLSIVDSAMGKPLAHWMKLSILNDMPLQSSLFDLCKIGADFLSNARVTKQTDLDLAITVLFDPAHHGSIGFDDWIGRELKLDLSRCETEGLEPAQRAIVAVCGDLAAIAFDSEKSVNALLNESATSVKIRRNPIGIYSMGYVSTAGDLHASNSTIAEGNEDIRIPALAGSFYPAQTEERRALVRQLKDSVSSASTASKALAIMTPHAGLRYSGQIAMDVWSRVQLPSTLLILGPKHTSLGSEWAVSPSQAWELPDGERWWCDKELAKKLVDGVEGLEFDSNAHLREHGIEIQLPILEVLSSSENRPKIVAIVLKNASWDEIVLASEQLANVLRDLPERPLLVISSDLNHFASEAENRRLDRLAITAMLSGDPKQLIDVCRENQISMCGLVPAAIVMQTLINLGEFFTVEEVSYDNSGSSSYGNDPNRVVGYGGIIFRSTASPEARTI